MKNLLVLLLDVVLLGLLLVAALSVVLFGGEPFVGLLCAS